MNREGESELVSRRRALFAGLAAVSAIAVPSTVLITSDDAEAETAGMARRQARRAARRTRRETRRATRRGTTAAPAAAPAAAPPQ
jgi:hypothetical protein